ncbi:hypothetical protein [Chryseobacterium oranimense]|nr:hypothetical protein [Chryseobacterium oranimense]
MSEIGSFTDGLDYSDESLNQQQTNDFEAIKNMLLTGEETGLILELLYEAFNQIKLDPEITISKACDNARWDWDC